MPQRSQTAEVVALVLLFLSITVMTITGFVVYDMPVVASEHGEGVDGVIRYLLLTTGAILVIGTVAFLVFLWRYGRGRATANPQPAGKAEYWWSLVPVLVMAVVSEVGVLVKGLPVWEQVYGEAPEDAVLIEASGKQFEWIIRYPGPDGEFGRTEPELVEITGNIAGIDPADPAGLDDVVTRNQLHLPLGRPVHMRLRARDVLHAFSIPAFRVKQDVVPGIVIGTTFVPTRLGQFEIACAELCGMGHYSMRAVATVHSEEDFQNWLDEQATGAP